MARGAAIKGGTSKVRLVVFEAEVSDGDLSQFTNAIQNALLPRQSAVRVIQSTPKALADDTGLSVAEETVEDLEGSPEPVISRVTRPSKPRSVKPPKVVNGVDWDADPSLKAFAEEFEVKTDFERYLVVAL